MLIGRSNFIASYGIGGVDDRRGEGMFWRNSKMRTKNNEDGNDKKFLLGERGTNRGTTVWFGVFLGSSAAMVLGQASNPPNDPASVSAQESHPRW